MANEIRNEVRNEVEWTTARGTSIKVVSGLNLSKNINADGHEIEVQCCEKVFEVEINGKHHDASGISTRGYPRKNKGLTVYAEMGNLCLTDPCDVTKIQKLIAKTESHPAWVEQNVKIEKNRNDNARLDAQRAANGYCPRCGSYCFGDCGV